MGPGQTPTRFDLWSQRRVLVSQKRRAPGSLPVPPAESWRERVRSLHNIRTDKVQAIREAIESGTYDLDARFRALATLFTQDPPPKPAA
jgi:hypothetical protein